MTERSEQPKQQTSKGRRELMSFLAYTWRNRHPHITAAIAHIRYKIIFRNQAHLDAALRWANDNTTDFAVQWTHTGNITKVLLRAR